MTRTEIHFKELKDTSLPLPIWYQDGFNKQWKSGKLILQGKGYAYISPDGSNKLTWLPPRKFNPRGPPAFKMEMKQQEPREEEIPIQTMVALKISREHSPRRHQPYDLPTWGQIKTLTNQVKNLISRDFPGGPVTRTLHSQCRGPGFDPWSGN